jgi:hypothetical protein
MKTLKTFFNPEKVTSFILYFSIFAFIIAFNFSDNPESGWYQQFLPDFNGKPLKDITFTDSLTGYTLIGYENSDSNFILKTTNAGHINCKPFPLILENKSTKENTS